MRRLEILLIKLGALGDVVRTAGLLDALRRRHAPCRVSWLTTRASRPLLRGHRVERAGAIEAPPAWLRTTRFDLVVSFDEDPAAARACSRASAEKRVGTYWDADGRVRYTADSAPVFGMSLLAPDRARADALKRANRAGYLTLWARVLGLRLRLRAPARARRARGAEVAVHAGSGARWPTKALPEASAAELLRLLKENGHSPVLVTGPGERRRNERILRLAGTGRLRAGLSLGALAHWLARCRAVVSTDSLPMHLAIAAGTPCVALFGPTSLAEIDDAPGLVKLRSRAACECFYRAACSKDGLSCMQTIAPRLIAARVSALAARSGTRSRSPRRARP